MSTRKPSNKHSGMQLAGFLLWRFGLLLAASVGIYRTLRMLFQFVELPLQLEIGIRLMASGALFFFGSLVLERIQAMRVEGDLTKDTL